jgi:hypothetical protein
MVSLDYWIYAVSATFAMVFLLLIRRKWQASCAFFVMLAMVRLQMEDELIWVSVLWIFVSALVLVAVMRWMSTNVVADRGKRDVPPPMAPRDLPTITEPSWKKIRVP